MISLDGAVAFGPVSVSSLRHHTASIVRKASEQNHDDASSPEEEEEEDRSSNNDTERDESDMSRDKEFTLDDIARIEEKASRRVMSRLLLPEKIGKAINFAGWFFVASSIALNAFGYSYIRGRRGLGFTLIR